MPPVTLHSLLRHQYPLTSPATPAPPQRAQEPGDGPAAGDTAGTRPVPPPLPPARVTMRDDTLPHQIRLRFTHDDGIHGTRCDLIGVFCSCGPTVLAKRTRWDDPGEPLRIWRQHMTEVTP